jgi:uncharacterized protein
MSAQWKIKPPLDVPQAGVWLGPGARDSTVGAWLGRLAESVNGKQPQVWIATAKEQVIGLFGKRGSGKSFTLGVLLEGLVVSSDAPHLARGQHRHAALLFDPLDIYWTSRFSVKESQNSEANRHFIIARDLELTGLDFEVEAWIPGESARRTTDPQWFGVLQIPVSALGLDEWSALLDVNVVTDPLGQALTDAIRLTTASGFTNTAGSNVPAKPSYDMSDIAAAADSIVMTASYHAETLRALRQRLSSFAGTGLFSATGIPLSQIMRPGCLTVVLLARLPQAYRAVVVALLTRNLITERTEVAFAEKRLVLDPNLSPEEKERLAAFVASGVPKTFVALDEAQSFLAPDRRTSARDTFIQLVKEGRNIGLSAVIATQQPSAIDRRILSQIETFIAHQLVTGPDIDAVRDNLKSAEPESIDFGHHSLGFGDMLRMLAPGQCLVSAADMNTTLRRCIAVAVRPRATVHGGIEL